MKTTNLTLITILTIVLTVIAPRAQADNPYEEGIKRVPLTPAEKANLLSYANDSKTELQKAIRVAQGKALSDANEIYLDAIKKVVAESFKEKRRSELLMRICLNQALEVTHGIPNQDGSGFQSPGIVNSEENLDLVTAILEDSINLAIRYYQDDRAAIEKSSLIELPYITFAQDRLRLGKEWLSGLSSWTLQLAFSQSLLEKWDATVRNQDQLTKERIAAVILDVDDVLTTKLTQPYSTQEKVRLLRGTIKRVLKDVEESGALNGKGATPLAEVVGLNPNCLSSPLGDFCPIPRGSFQMGSPGQESGRYDDEGPQHQVTISQDFEMQVTTVTQAQWVAVMGSNPSYFKEMKYCAQYRDNMCPTNPVEQVSWNDTQAFIGKLNAKNDGYMYRLPTEAEWEYAARAGSQSAYSFGDNANELSQYGWYSGNSGSQTHEVGSLRANNFGLKDMQGNVWQWVQDWYGNYPSGSVANPQGPSSGSSRVVRGGGWSSGAQGLRSAFRGLGSPDYHGSDVGLRLSRTRR